MKRSNLCIYITRNLLTYLICSCYVHARMLWRGVRNVWNPDQCFFGGATGCRPSGPFRRDIIGCITSPDLPSVGHGGRDFLDTAMGRIAAANGATPAGSASIGKIRGTNGSLRQRPDGRDGSSKEAIAAMGEANTDAWIQGHTHERPHGAGVLVTNQKGFGPWPPKQPTCGQPGFRSGFRHRDMLIATSSETTTPKGKSMTEDEIKSPIKAEKPSLP